MQHHIESVKLKKIQQAAKLTAKVVVFYFACIRVTMGMAWSFPIMVYGAPSIPSKYV